MLQDERCARKEDEEKAEEEEEEEEEEVVVVVVDDDDDAVAGMVLSRCRADFADSVKTLLPGK